MSVSLVVAMPHQQEPVRIRDTLLQSLRVQTTGAMHSNGQNVQHLLGPKSQWVVKHDDSLTASVGNNPASEGYYIVWCFNEGNVSATNVLAHVRIEYEVRFTRPIQVAVS